MYIKWENPDLISTGQTHQFDAFLVGTSTFGRLRPGARALYFTRPLKLLNCMHRDVMFQYL